MSNLIKHENNQIAISSKEDFVLKFNPKEMNQSFGQITKMNQAIEADKNSIAYYRANFSENTVLSTLKMHLLSLQMSLNVHQKLSEEQIDEIAFEIMNLYYHLSMVEIHFIFKKAKRGEFGKINYAINMPDVMQWFSTYAEQRTSYFMQRSDSEGNQNKQNVESSSKLDELSLAVLSKVKEESPDVKQKEADFKRWKAENQELIITKKQNDE